MKNVIYNKNDNNIPIKLWLEDIEEGALEQAKNLSRLPFAFRHVAIMPDSHQGYGMPIGGVLATKGVIIPHAVGVDIGCGMCANKTIIDAEELDTETLKEIIGEIRERIPVGFNWHDEPQETELESTLNLYNNNQKYFKQLGTLGGGNHFIEIQKGDDGKIWVMVHSGSRKFGYNIAKRSNEKAKDLNKKWYSSVPESYELAFLPEKSKEGQNYIKEMNYAVDYALENRKIMMRRIRDAFEMVLSEDCFVDDMINIAHNYASKEEHFGEEVWVHRKGATSAKEGQLGIIPGSQGSKSYIVRGKGNPESFKSCSHGAGRTMSRTQAKKDIDLEESKKKMENKGIIHAVRNKGDLDEAPEAYKDISKVMKNQEDLVDIEVELTPLGVIKG